MHEYFVQNPIMAIIFIVLMVAVMLLVAIKVLQTIGFEKIRKVVYDGFVEAEHEFQYGENTEKFDYVIQLARSHIPLPYSLLITESLLRKIIQTWFDLCKDLLDDCKLNNTINEEKEG